MIKEISGDILLSDAEAIAHGVAPDDHFSQGLALSLREQWPALAKDFRHFCHNESPEPGEIWVWKGTDGKYIVNLLTQEAAPSHGQKPGKARTEYLNRALHHLAKFLKQENIKSCALPKIATGVGGLEWKDVQPLVKQTLGDLETKVAVYTTYQKGVKGHE